MGEDVRLRPHFSLGKAMELARELYGIDVTANELPSERDQNFLLTTANGEKFVLKIANLGASPQVLACQNEVMSRLAQEGIPCPHPLPTLRGQLMCEVPDEDGEPLFVRLVTFLPGTPLALVKPHTPAILRKIGRLFGSMDRVLASLSCPALARELQWDLQSAPSTIRRYKADIRDAGRRSLIDGYLELFDQVADKLAALRRMLIHNDGNDYNVLVGPPAWEREVVGVLDFGDMVVSYAAAEPAVVAAYAMLGKDDPVGAAAEVIAGYHSVFPLREEEVEVLFPLMCMRLCLSVCLEAHQRGLVPGNEYLSVSAQPAWDLLERLKEVPPRLAEYRLRDACGYAPCPQGEAVAKWLAENRHQVGPVVAPELMANAVLFDFAVGGCDAGAPHLWQDVAAFSKALFDKIAARQGKVGLGRYAEARPFYTSALFAGGEPRTVHLGVDLFVPAGQPVLAPLEGTVVSVQDNAGPLNYGPTVILQHEAKGQRPEFYTLYGHLSRKTLTSIKPGRRLKRGDTIGWVGESSENGGWPPHVHLQVIADMLGYRGDFPGVASPSQRAVWLSICPDPSPLLGRSFDLAATEELSTRELLARRSKHFSPVLSVAYRRPLHLVRGYRQFLYDRDGIPYLDAVNNVPHVGHSHPKVVEAACRQMALLNTNTRYLYEELVAYAERLTATLPEPLRICFFVNSGSEANELALRLAEAFTGGRETIVVDGAYHGNTTSLIDISPYKFNGPGGQGAPSYVHVVPTPDPYRGLYRQGQAHVGKNYARHVQQAADELRARGVRPIFICESLMGCAGQIVLPDGFLAEAYRAVREAGGICIADEVQVGFGRVGTHFWGFQTQGVVPDIVTLGKPIGNGFPLGAVITTPEVAAAFHSGMEYFSTFGGNPVACAVGLAVLEVIGEEHLQENALRVGSKLKAGLTELMARHELIGDVRGMGLFLGVELVLDRERLTPATEQAAYVVERMKELGVLLGRDGPAANVLKIKPPLVFSEADAERLVATLDRVLDEDFVAGR
ncbi:MAG: aminotransferase class III-fold pyridoxal phosphate-dependent enzyme [Calditrichaeota bacterium]|nr:aminotransferase class III-fold pyridoxal phosphate-dependent enzyme [Calditrichota bacterium]